MPNAISITQLTQYQQAIENGGVKAVAQVYAELNAQGYHYAGWAEGVARGNTLTGLAALDFLQDSYFTTTCDTLSDAQIDKIRVDMALRTLDQYIDIATRTNGQLTRDLIYEETEDIHKEVFENNDLSLDNWTLHLPMELIRQQHGDQAVETAWEEIRDTGGDYADAWKVSGVLFHYVWKASHSHPDPEVRQRAERWLEHVVPDWLEGNFSGKSCDNPFKQAKRWQPPRDPLILDLDGDGLETVGLASNVYFDHNGDGVLTQTGWVGRDDALLVWDRNANGTIDTGAELFGDFTPLPNGTLAPNGFAALAALDSNGDGILDASDPAFAELKLWRDASQDGRTGQVWQQQATAMG